MHAFAEQLWPYNRSITGEGVRQTLRDIKQICPQLEIIEVPSGTEVFDWTIPREWKVSEAWIKTPSGEKICDFSKNNLHLLGYSVAVNQKLSLSELQEHLYSLEDQPDAIPYITSYYNDHWGFCLSEDDRSTLVEGEYQVYIDAEHFEGSLSYGEIVLPGTSKKEIFLSTYVCHPSMANNELSGPVVATFIAKWLGEFKSRKFTYRIVFVPETIGSITYLSKNLKHLKSNVVGGFNVTCVGDDRAYSFLPSRNGDTISDRIGRHVLHHIDKDYFTYGWGDRGSDERQYCAPHVDLPIATIMRTKYGRYDEYHTSLDDLENVVTAEGLEGGYNALRDALEVFEKDCFPRVSVFGEPQLGKRGLYPNVSTKKSRSEVKLMMDLISWSDGKRSLLEISEICGVAFAESHSLLERLVEHDLIELLEEC